MAEKTRLLDAWIVPPNGIGATEHHSVVVNRDSGTPRFEASVSSEPFESGFSRLILFRSDGKSRLLDLPVLDLEIGRSNSELHFLVTLRGLLWPHADGLVTMAVKLKSDAGRLVVDPWEFPNVSETASSGSISRLKVGTSVRFPWDGLLAARTVAHSRAGGDSSHGRLLSAPWLIPSQQPTAISFQDNGTVEALDLVFGRLDARQRTRLHPLADGVLPQAQWLLSSPLAPAAVFERVWNQNVAEALFRGLRTTKEGRELSFLPRLQLPPDAAPWQATVLLTDGFRRPNSGGLDAGDFRNRIEAEQVVLFPADVLTLDLESLRPASTAAKVGALATFPCLLDHDHQPAGLALALRDLEPPPSNIAVDRWHARPLWSFAVGERQAPVPAESRTRFGSLDLLFDGRVLGETSRLAAELRPSLEGDYFRPEINLDLHLGVSEIRVGGQDDPPTQKPEPVSGQLGQVRQDGREQEPRRQRPIIVPATATGQQGFFELAARESSDGSVREIELRLLERPGEAARRLAAAAPEGQRVLVLDPEPLMVAAIDVPPFRGERAGLGILEIGNWSGSAAHGASWELRGDRAFPLWLPPQAVGEQMEKYFNPPIPPVPPVPPVPPFEDLAENAPADFRFSPPAELELQATYFAQRFTEAPWNLRRILGFPGQRAPGAGLVKVRFELLYGLEGEIAKDGIRVAELASRLGEIPGGLPPFLPWDATAGQIAHFKTYRGDWAAFLRSYLRRLAILEPWREAAPRQLFHLDDGIAWRLRGLDEVRPAELAYPIPDRRPRPDLAHRIPTVGLAGGATWGFESDNIYHAVWREPHAVAGEISRLFLSPLGGWGYLKASFDRRLSSIYADVAMGRTFYYSLERIGRIGVYWNRARHVIVYDRTVAPSRQFHEPDEIDHQAGRPLPRKTEEFVQLFEEKRFFPEFGAADSTRGPVLGIEFKTTKIPVDSRWGGDVRDVGWQVPLWRPGLDLEIYPKPTICLLAAADPESGKGTTLLEIDDPQKLVFFTDTRPPEIRPSDSDLWPAVSGIDYQDLPIPRPPAIQPMVAAHPDAALPSPPAIDGGLEAFTLSVLPAERPVNLVAGRSNAVIATTLHNVSLMRSSPASGGPHAESARQVADRARNLPAALHRLVDGLVAILPGQGGGPVGVQLKKQLVAQLDLQARNLATDIGLLGSAWDNLPAALLDPSKLCALLVQEMENAIERQFGKGFDRVENELIAQVDRSFAELGSQEEQLRKQLQQQVVAFFAPFEQGIGIFAAGFDRLEAAAEALRKELKQTVDGAASDLAAALALIEGTTADGIAATRAELAGRHAQFERVVTPLLLAIEAKLAKIGDPRWAGKAFSLRMGLAGLRRQIPLVFLRADAELAKALAGTQTLDAAKVVLRTLAARVNASFASLQIEEIARELRQEVENLRQGVAAARKATLDGLARTTPVGELRVKLLANVAELRKLAAFEDTLRDPLKEACEALAADVKTLLTQLAGLVQEAVRELGDLIEAFAGEAAALLAHLLRGIDQLVQAVGAAVDLVLERLARALAALAGALEQVGSNVLRLLRAFGDAPRVPQLAFNRPQLGFYFNVNLPDVDLTPVAAFFDRLGDNLKGFGLRLPTFSLGDRLLPGGLGNFDLSTIFPDFGGIRLDGMFPGIRLPEISKDLIKVRHGIDKQSRRGWIEAEIDVPITQSSEVFSIGPVTVRLLKCQFKALARAESGLDGKVQNRQRGELRGDWELSIGGTPILRLRDTSATYEGGEFRFNISPDRVELPGALKFIADLIKKTGVQDSGLSFRLIEEGGAPRGVEAILDLPLPDITAGAFTLTKLRLLSTFALLLETGSGGLDFKLATRFQIGSRNNPFSLSITFLAGGGYVEVAASYKPSTGDLETSVAVGVVAGAALAFRLGPVAGGVALLFGVEAEFQGSSRRGGSLYLAQVLIVYGEVTAFGFLSVSLHLRLALTYGSTDGSLVGTGSLSIEVKIGRFFKKSFSSQVRYEFKKGRSGGSRSLRRAEDSALVAAAPAARALQVSEYQRLAKIYLEMISG